MPFRRKKMNFPVFENTQNVAKTLFMLLTERLSVNLVQAIPSNRKGFPACIRLKSKSKTFPIRQQISYPKNGLHM